MRTYVRGHSGHATAAGQWYDQDQDEWVLLLQGEAELEFADGHRVRLQAGDYLLLPAHCRHRVAWTQESAPSVWLAIHGDLSDSRKG